MTYFPRPSTESSDIMFVANLAASGAPASDPRPTAGAGIIDAALIVAMSAKTLGTFDAARRDCPAAFLTPALTTSATPFDALPAAASAFCAPGMPIGVTTPPAIRPPPKTLDSDSIPRPAFRSDAAFSFSAAFITRCVSSSAENRFSASEPMMSPTTRVLVAIPLAAMSAVPWSASITPTAAPAAAGLAPSAAMVFNTSVTPTSFPDAFCFFSDSWMRLLACSAAPQVESTTASQAFEAAVLRSKSWNLSLIRPSRLVSS